MEKRKASFTKTLVEMMSIITSRALDGCCRNLVDIRPCFTTHLSLYDGSPFYPTPETQLAAVFSAGVTAWGAGPRYFSEIQKVGVNPKPYASIMIAGIAGRFSPTNASSRP